MKTNKIVCLLALGLLCGSVTAQQSESTRSVFQGLWQERSGHSLHLTYGFFVDTWFVQHAKNGLPFRFDLDYQYDIPWKFKRVNFFTEAGLAYMWAGTGETDLVGSDRSVYHRASGHLSVGLKVHCTDWLYLSLGGGLNVGGLCPTYLDGKVVVDAFDVLLWGGYSSAVIVGQIRQFSISLGYRADHWPVWDYLGINTDRREKTTDWFITLGVGYHF